MSKKDSGVAGHYIVLWVLVLFVSAIVFVSYGAYKVGHGRWECSETTQPTTTIKCDYKQEHLEDLNNTKLGVVLRNGCEWEEPERTCSKMVWTRK